MKRKIEKKSPSKFNCENIYPVKCEVVVSDKLESCEWLQWNKDPLWRKHGPHNPPRTPPPRGPSNPP